MVTGMESEAFVVVDSTASASSKVSAMPLPEPTAPAPTVPTILERIGRSRINVSAWARRAAIACGAMAAFACTGALASDPINDALSLVAQERYPEAREMLEPMLERDPDAPAVRLLNGVLLAREGHIAEALSIFENLRNDHPAMFEVHNNLAVLYAKLGQLEDARKSLIAALELRPDAVVYANLGDVYLKLAEQAYQHAHEFRDQAAPAPEAQEAEASAQPEETTDEPSETAAVPDDTQDTSVEAAEPEVVREEPEAAPARASS